MPTIHPRHQVTETPDLAAALDRAAVRWPSEARSKLIVRLATIGDTVLTGEESSAEEARRAAVRRLGSEYSAGFPDGYLYELREDWPE